ncbi:hypothetical protein PVAND_015636 [Polypedilum vanderplanki]|uniref:Uncharacterized protein n=1 Tax=Polypedilum vanderplanki TaxID=319348 RepID=A0A9J6BDG1_POLVA|nr:hypothetical protein PVAND_015636 [Polypedilum vanderplanki]
MKNWIFCVFIFVLVILNAEGSEDDGNHKDLLTRLIGIVREIYDVKDKNIETEINLEILNLTGETPVPSNCFI